MVKEKAYIFTVFDSSLRGYHFSELVSQIFIKIDMLSSSDLAPVGLTSTQQSTCIVLGTNTKILLNER